MYAEQRYKYIDVWYRTTSDPSRKLQQNCLRSGALGGVKSIWRQWHFQYCQHPLLFKTVNPEFGPWRDIFLRLVFQRYNELIRTVRSDI